jgi:hypothetical protein
VNCAAANNRVTIECGILVRAAPHIVAPPGEALRVGTAFAATTRVVVRYEGLGDVTFVQVIHTCVRGTSYNTVYTE